MAELREIIDYCDGLLGPEAFSDYGPNGLQVPGREQVDRVATGVSANLETLERAVSGGAALLLVHHGLFWDFHPRALTRPMAARLRVLLDADVSLAAYHLPLDAHPEIGNNALLCQRLGFAPAGRFAETGGAEIGVIGRAEGIAIDLLAAEITGLLGREPLVQGSGPATVASIGIVSGAAAKTIHEAAALGLDALLTGEPAEHAMADAAEAGIHFIAAGHYATETLGIRRLGELIAERFDIPHEFIDVPNPV